MVPSVPLAQLEPPGSLNATQTHVGKVLRSREMRLEWMFLNFAHICWKKFLKGDFGGADAAGSPDGSFLLAHRGCTCSDRTGAAF